MTDARLDYLELPVGEASASAAFFERAFGWQFTAFGPTYAATTTGDVDVGLQGDPTEQPAAPLPVIRVAALEDALAAVTAAGGTITKPIFAYPGGRRFHFREPGGCELAVYMPA